jgi:hypothetical protein
MRLLGMLLASASSKLKSSKDKKNKAAIRVGSTQLTKLMLETKKSYGDQVGCEHDWYTSTPPKRLTSHKQGRS